MDETRRLRQTVSEYDAQGWHRTGTAVDNASAGWLRDRLTAMGVEAYLEEHAFNRLVPGTATLVSQDLRIDGLPAFDGGLTAAQGITGKIGWLGGESAIGVTIEHPSRPSSAFVAARQGHEHEAIVVVTEDGHPGLAAMNATEYLEPHGPPILQVANQHRVAIERLCTQGAEVQLTVSATRETTSASNVVGRIPGARPDLRPIVVMTPRSGWWQCASERGTGIACWLETARAAQALEMDRDVWLIASTGHELGFWGMHQFLGKAPAAVKDAALWIHFGASIGAALAPRRGMATSDPQLQELAWRFVSDARISELTMLPEGTRPAGESGIVHDFGGRYVSFLGGSAVFHTESDRWPAAVDIDLVARYCAATAMLLRHVQTQPATLK